MGSSLCADGGHHSVHPGVNGGNHLRVLLAGGLSFVYVVGACVTGVESF